MRFGRVFFGTIPRVLAPTKSLFCVLVCFGRQGESMTQEPVTRFSRENVRERLLATDDVEYLDSYPL